MKKYVVNIFFIIKHTFNNMIGYITFYIFIKLMSVVFGIRILYSRSNFIRTMSVPFIMYYFSSVIKYFPYIFIAKLFSINTISHDVYDIIFIDMILSTIICYCSFSNNNVKIVSSKNKDKNKNDCCRNFKLKVSEMISKKAQETSSEVSYHLKTLKREINSLDINNMS